MKLATIDIGTNTVLLLIAELTTAAPTAELSTQGTGTPRWAITILREEAEITRLGKGVDHSHRLDAAAVTATLRTLDRFADLLEAEGIALSGPNLAVVGTSALRDSDNAAEGAAAFRAAFTKRFGRSIRLLSGREEAELIAQGALLGLPEEAQKVVNAAPRVLLFDIGGGSTEFILLNRSATSGALEVKDAVSLDMGSVRLSERYVHGDPPLPEERLALGACADAALATLDMVPQGALVVGTSGTVTTLAAAHLGLDPYDGARVHGLQLPATAFPILSDQIWTDSLSARMARKGISPKRADVLPAGAEWLCRILQWARDRGANTEQLLISDRGVRWGLMLQLAEANAALSALPNAVPNPVVT